MSCLITTASLHDVVSTTLHTPKPVKRSQYLERSDLLGQREVGDELRLAGEVDVGRVHDADEVLLVEDVGQLDGDVLGHAHLIDGPQRERGGESEGASERWRKGDESCVYGEQESGSAWGRGSWFG